VKTGSFTSGPWEIRERVFDETPWRKRRVYRVEIIAPQYYHGKRTHSRDICQMVDYCEWTDHPANARLIAAAPNLYHELRELLGSLEPLENTLTGAGVSLAGARCALSKASSFSPNKPRKEHENVRLAGDSETVS
jgi:hypothetical protein